MMLGQEELQWDAQTLQNTLGVLLSVLMPCATWGDR